MLGSVFVGFSQWVEERFGLEVWDQAVGQSNLASEGAYTSGGRYNDSEIVALLEQLAKLSEVKVADLLRQFGEFLFPLLYRSMVDHIDDDIGLKDFLLMLDSVVHGEVRRLYPDATVPKISVPESDGETSMILQYQSPRKLCALCEGLLIGAAKEFQQAISISHPKCMHEGYPCCEIHIKFEDIANG